ncbi:MAG: asparagine synthetase B family protein [Terriglobales bacterium]
MSAHAGIWNRDSSPISRDSLSGLRQALERYGPDGESIVSKGSVAVLHRAFHTTQDSQDEQQPYWSQKGALVTWNGRLDNRDQLILELGTLCDGNTDVEVIAEAFDRWGEDCFRRLVGDWAISIWNPQANELLLARDYIGVKQMFYFASANRLMWSSHLVALALCGQSFRFCPEYAAGYLTLHPLEHRTPYEEIMAVRPGAFIRISPHEVTESEYWQFDPHLRTVCASDAEYEEQYRYLFGQAVRRRLRSATPILAELSGGFDSSAVTCMADYVMEQIGAETPRIDTFTFCDASEPDEEDSQYARFVEGKRGRTGHHCVVQEFGDAIRFDAPDFRATPNLPRNEIEMALPAILQSGGYRVVLSGLGGDEVNGQAVEFRVLIAESLHSRKWKAAGRQTIEWSFATGIPFIQILWQSARILLPAQFRTSKSTFKDSMPWLNPAFFAKYGMLADLLAAAKGSRKWGPWMCDSYQTLDGLRRQLTDGNPAVTDKRYPYLDLDLMRFLLSIPQEQLIRPGDRRSLMRRALRDMLPPELIDRKTKGSAARCVALTLSKHWGVIADAMASPFTAEMGIVDAEQFRSALTALKHGKLPTHMVSLLRVLALELWMRNNIARGVVRSSAFHAAAVETAVMAISA